MSFGDDGFEVKPHRILRTEKGCIYDEKQELDEFYRRSKAHDALLSGDENAEKEFEEGFSKDCANWTSVFLSVFRGKNSEDSEKRAALSPAEFLQYLKSSYSREQLLAMQMFMRNEEFNEVGNQILSDLLRETDTKENHT